MKAEDIKLRFIPRTFKLSKIEDEVYFSKKYKNYISNSRFGLLDPAKDGSPEKFFKGFEDQGFKEFFELHCYIFYRLFYLYNNQSYSKRE